MNKIISACAVLLTVLLCGCDGEKDLIIYDGVLPMKSTTMYMVGDAAPCGWKQISRTPMVRDSTNGYHFSYNGPLIVGQLKFSLIAETWDDPFIRPAEPELAITEEGLTDQGFVFWAGNPDDKWYVKTPGIYQVDFDLKNWKYSFAYKGEIPVEPFMAQNVFPIGDACVGIGWDLTKTTSLSKKSDYVWEGDVKLRAGYEVKFLTERSWSGKQVRPYESGMKWTRDGLADVKVTDAKTPDNKWKVIDAGTYHVVINLQKWRINATLVSE